MLFINSKIADSSHTKIEICEYFGTIAGESPGRDQRLLSPDAERNIGQKWISILFFGAVLKLAIYFR